MRNLNIKKIMSLGLTLLIMLSVLVPAFSMVAHAAPTAADFIIDDTQSIIVTNYDIEGAPTEVKKDDIINIVLNVIDNRVTYKATDPSTDNIKLSLVGGGAFDISGATVMVEAINNVGTNGAGNKIMGFRIKFSNLKCLGAEAGKNLDFSVGYINAAYTPITVDKPITHTISQIVDAAPTPEVPSNESIIDSTKPIYIANYVVMDVAGNEVTSVKPGDNVIIALNIVDERIKHTVGKQPKSVRARLSQGAFTSSNAENVSYTIRDLATEGSKIAFQYAVVFHDIKYLGGVPEISFDVSYPNDANIPVSLPNSILKQSITQAVDDIPEPKVILNSADYGGVAVIGKNFTLSTVATNTSDFVALDNVSVRIELPKGMAMSGGNSQVLVGSVSKKGQISHGFNLIVTGVENDVTSLPIKLTYEFEAYVKGVRKTYTSVQDISVNIEQATKFDISKLNFMETVNVGEEGSISVSLVNKGKTTIYNVTAEIKSDKVNGTQTTFVGNVNPGSESSADIYFPVGEPGTITGKVIVTYEDAKGKSSTIEKDFSMEAMEAPMYPGFDIPTDIPEEPKKSVLPWIIGIVVVAAGAGGAFIVIKKRKEAKKLEDENEDI